MKSRWLVNLALFVVVAALATFAWYRTGERGKDERAPLTPVAASDVRQITIRQPTRAPIVLERAHAGWRMRAPISARANGFVVDNLLRVLRAPIEATVPAAAPARYGVGEQSLSVRFDDLEVTFGQQHPLKDLYYARAGDAIHLIARHYYATAAGAYTNYIDARLLEEDRSPIAFQLPGFTLTLADGAWKRQPEDAHISNDRINDFVEEWRHARALSVERYSRRAVVDRIRISFETDDSARKTLTLGILARQPELVLYRQDEGLEYHFPADTGKRLLGLTADEG